MNIMGRNIIIIDLGVYSTKVGIADMNEPQFTIRSLMNSSKTSEDILFGDEAIEKSNETLPLLDYKWDTMEIRWSKIFDFFRYIFEEKLKISASELMEYTVVLLIGPMQPRSHFIRYYQALFSKFKVKEVLIISATRMALLASWKTTGVVVDIGYKSTRVVPFYEGFRFAHAFNHQDLAGKDIDEFGEEILEIPMIPEKKYHIPTSEMIVKVIEWCDEEVRDELYSNIIFSGWWSANPKITDMIYKNMQKRLDDHALTMVSPSTPFYNWTAAAQLATNQLKDIAVLVYLPRKKYEIEKKWEKLLLFAGFKTKKWGLISYPL
ncbi:MAG: hypothetical protein GF364_10405 [Candidatus Lokiarchaeota archaeon]|nr:hypothetical protein [Candidatus Lokiarchaeota archaeon]